MFKKYIVLLFTFLLVSCTGVPKGIQPVDNFDVNAYMGEWFEIARLNHSFEEGLTDVTATYSLREDGGVDVVNRGVSIETGEADIANGKAYFIGEKNIGHLKVSFFGPFYGAYVVFKLDAKEYAYITSYNKDYLWLLSRTPTVSDERLNDFIETAKHQGFDVSELIIDND